MTQKSLYVFDFDGVICDSAVETAQSAWRVCRQLWPALDQALSPALLDDFTRVRPALETGFEAVLILRGLRDAIPVQQWLTEFAACCDAVVARYALQRDSLKTAFAAVRDQWIADNYADWIAHNPLFDEVSAKLQQLPVERLIILTTKQARFVQAILAANQLMVPDAQIHGLERNRSKVASLRLLLESFAPDRCVLIEDRYATLCEVAEQLPDPRLHLHLATWGYNTAEQRRQAAEHPHIRLLDREHLAGL